MVYSDGCGSTLCDWSDRTVCQHPLPSRKMLSSDLGESHGLAGLGLGGHVPPVPPPVATPLQAAYVDPHLKKWGSIDPLDPVAPRPLCET